MSNDKTKIEKSIEDYFLKRYGNKITASESWVIGFTAGFHNAAQLNQKHGKRELARPKTITAYKSIDKFELQVAHVLNDILPLGNNINVYRMVYAEKKLSATLDKIFARELNKIDEYKTFLDK